MALLHISQQEIDQATLQALQELLGDRFAELVATYIEDASKYFNLLKESLAEQDFDAVSQRAHRLRGSSRNLGADSLADLCESLENQARIGAIDDQQQLLAAIEQRLAAVLTLLEPLR